MIWIKATNSYSVQAWVTQTARIVDSAPGRVTFKTLPRNDHDIYRPGPGNDYYLMGKRAALDSPGEWFYENGALYLRTPGGDAPSAHVIEFKTRQHAFDLSYRDSIKVRGLQITASSVNMTESTHCELDGLRGTLYLPLLRAEQSEYLGRRPERYRDHHQWQPKHRQEHGD